MPTQVKALVHCSGINTFECEYKGVKGIGGTVNFSFNYHNQDDKHPNRIYFDSTPCGDLSMQINNPEALKHFTPGKDYSMLLTQIDPETTQ